MINVFMVTMIAHMICEFVLLPEFLYVGKGNTIQGAIIHLIMVNIFTFGMVFYFFGHESWPLSLIIGASHCFIDLVKPVFLRKINPYHPVYFMLDQLCHLLILVVAAQIAAKNTPYLEGATVAFLKMGTLFLVGIGLSAMFARVAAYNLFPKQYKKRGVMVIDEVFCDTLFGISVVVLLKMVPNIWISIAGLVLVWILYTVISWGLARMVPLTAIIKGMIMVPIIFSFTKFLPA